MTKVLYPGSFDPITKGHMNIIKQASDLFDEVVVAVLQNKSKNNGFFTLEERIDILKKLYENIDNVKIVTGDSASVDIALLYGCKAIVRGLRSLSDYDYEVQIQQVNKEISNGQINTVCLFADSEYQFVSSSVVKEIFGLDKDISKYVPPVVVEKMKAKKKDGRN